MSDNENNTKNVENNTYEKIQVGKPYMIILHSDSIVTGTIVSKIEGLTNNGIKHKYKMWLCGETFIDIQDDEIKEITEIVESNTEEYFQEFHDKYGVKCFNDGELLSSSSILNNILSKNELWDGLSQEEKEELMNHLRLDAKDVIDLTTALMSCRKENEKLHNEKLKIYDTTTELMQNYNAVKKVFTDTRDSYNVFFNMLGMDQFIKEICK